MEFGRIKILRLSLLAAFSLSGLLGCASAFAASEDAGTSATLDAFILPEYRRDDNRLQCILYGDKAVNQGAFITLTNPLLDIVHDNIRDINAIANFQSLKLFSIDTPTKTIRDFWKGKEHCRAIVSSPTAVYDRTTKMLRGDAPVFFRSLGMDIDGVGFDLNEETKYTPHTQQGARRGQARIQAGVRAWSEKRRKKRPRR
jgi:hypothetical protein